MPDTDMSKQPFGVIKMKRVLMLACLVAACCSSPAVAGLSLGATFDQPFYTAADASGSVTISVVNTGATTQSFNTLVAPSGFVLANPSFRSEFSMTGATITSQSALNGFQNVETAPNVSLIRFGAPVTLAPGASLGVWQIGFDPTADVVSVAVNAIEVFGPGGPQTGALDGAGVGTLVNSGGPIGVAAVPEPSSMVLLGLVGAGTVGAQYWRRRKDSNEAEDEAQVAV